MTIDLNAATAEEAAAFVAERDARAAIGADAAAEVRDGIDAYHNATLIVRQAVNTIFGEDPYAGYFEWKWTLNGGDVVIYAWTYGGHMDRQRQALPTVRFPLDDIVGVVAGTVEPEKDR